MKRRSLIKALAAGSVTAMTPLAAMLARSAMAAETQRIRTLFIYHPNGCVPDVFFPRAGALAGAGFPAMTAPLQQVAQHLVFLDGIGYEGNANTHEGGALKCLTGVASSASGASSIEVQMGKEDWLNRASSGVSRPSLQMGVGTKWGSDTSKRVSYDNGTSLHPVDDPRILYPQLFGSNGGGGDTTQVQVLARAREDLARLTTQLGSLEKERLDQHVAALDVLEQKLNAASMSGCLDVTSSIKPRVDSISGGEEQALWATSVLANISAIQQDIAVSTLSCGITRSIAFMYGVPVSPIVVPGTGTGDHDLSHQDAAAHTTSKIWWMGQIRQFIQKLAATPDVNGSLLDNTVICTVSDLGHGNRHDHYRIPMFLAGGKNAGLITGRSVDLRPLGEPGKRWGDQQATQGGVNHTNVLMTIAEKAGYTSVRMPTANGRINNVWVNGTGL
ncbi:MAG TPA: DUF1552 domain-containing protein [Cellvibrio sp.]|nr:DUF1552 domain-containing protein [Cellvibrio sp.]